MKLNESVQKINNSVDGFTLQLFSNKILSVTAQSRLRVLKYSSCSSQSSFNPWTIHQSGEAWQEKWRKVSSNSIVLSARSAAQWGQLWWTMREENIDHLLQTVLVPATPPNRSQWRKLELALKFINKSKKSVKQKKSVTMMKKPTIDDQATVEENNNKEFYGCIHRNILLGSSGLKNIKIKVSLPWSQEF